MTVRRLVILGGPGDGVVVAEAALLAQAAGAPYEVVGFLNDAIPAGEIVHGLPVLGRFEDWPRLGDEFVFCPAVQKVKEMQHRIRRLKGLGLPDDRLITVRHPLSAVASDVTIGPGCFIASFCTVQPGGRIGRCASLRAGASLGHHATVDDHAYVGPNATMCGRTRLMEGAHLGPNAVLIDFKTVGRFAVVGIGAAVTKDVADYAVVMGNPARRVSIIKRLADAEPKGMTEAGNCPGRRE